MNMHVILLCHLVHILTINPTSSSDPDPIEAIKKLNIDDKAQATQSTSTTYLKEDKNTINKYHDLSLKNEFSEIVRPYLVKFETMKKNNLENIKNFAGNLLIHITYKSLNKDILERIVETCDEILKINLDTSDLKMMYYALEILEKNVLYKDIYTYYQSIFQNFSYNSIHNQKSFDIFYTNDTNIEKICNFAKTYDKKNFSNFIAKEYENFDNKTIVIDKCCTTKEDFQILSKLYECVLVRLTKITNSITISIKCNVNDKENTIKELNNIFNHNMKLIYQNNLDIYLSEIINLDNTYKIQAKKWNYIEEEKIMALNILDKNSDLLSTYLYPLNPYSIGTRMSIDYNQPDINQYKNLDTKLFFCEQNDDIYNIKITLSNKFSSYDYTFVRMIERKGENGLVVRYIGLYNELGCSKKIWMCIEYNYLQQGNICKRLKSVDSNQINNFFCNLESALLQNSYGGIQFILLENIRHFVSINKLDVCLWFDFQKSGKTIYERLHRMFSRFEEKEWKIEIIDKGIHNLCYSKICPYDRFYPPELNIAERSETSQMWKTWSTKQNFNFEEIFLKFLFARFSYTKLDHRIQFYMKVDTDMIFKFDNIDGSYNNMLNEKCGKYIKSIKQKNFILYKKNEKCNIMNPYPKNNTEESLFDFDKIVNFCCISLHEHDHQLLLKNLDLRNKFFKYKLAQYIMSELRFKEKNKSNAEEILRIQNIKTCH
ncbi:hypothetical protein COBT_000731 [Conglomerata obtusa]